MPSGGYHNGGRPKGSKNSGPRKGSKAYEAFHKRTRKRKDEPAPEPTEADKIRQMLTYGTKAKARMYQEFLQRISQGGTLTTTEKKLFDKIGGELAAELKPEAPKLPAECVDLEAEEYLRKVWNDPNMDPALRIRAAEIAFKGSEGKLGKKEVKDKAAKAAGSGKFAASAPPLKLVGNKP
jgi:hypothetical protein